MKKRIFVIGAVLAVCLLAVLGVRYAPALFNAGVGSRRDMPVYELCAGENDLWVVYNMDGGFSEFGVYSYGKEERGTESRPRLEGRPCWEGTSERFWYLEKDSLQAYDPVTGAVTVHPLDRAYQQIGAAAADAVVLQEETGAVWLYLPENGMEAQLSVPAGMILRGDYDGCIVVKTDGADGTRDLICWDYQTDQKRWQTSLSGRFADGYQLTVCGDQILLTYKQAGGTVWAADMSDGVFAPLTEKRVLSVVGTENVLICAGRAPWGAAIYAIYPDGTEEQLGNLEDEYIFQKYDPIRLAVWDGKVYCGRVEEGDIFSFDLPEEEAEEPEEPLTPLPVYLPRANYQMYTETPGYYGWNDEVLFDYLVAPGICNTDRWEDQPVIPMLHIYDEWEDGSDTYYLGGITLYSYRNLKEQLETGKVDLSAVRCREEWNTLVRIRLSDPTYTESPYHIGRPLVTELLLRPEKGDGGRYLKELCAGRPIEKVLLNWQQGGEAPPYRILLPEQYDDPMELLRRYLETYFPGRIAE